MDYLENDLKTPSDREYIRIVTGWSKLLEQIRMVTNHIDPVEAVKSLPDSFLTKNRIEPKYEDLN